jgi:tetratricopeptide (TPR) repeat protein
MRNHRRFPLPCLALCLLLACSLRADSLADGIAQWKAGQNGQAVTTLKAAFREDPTNVDACVYLGLAAAATGDHELAVVMFENALMIDPSLDRVRLELGRSYFALGMLNLAEKQFKTVLAHGVADANVRQNIEGFLASITEKRQTDKHVFLQSYLLRLEAARDSNARVSPTGSVEFDVDIPGLNGPLNVPIERDAYLALWASGNFEYRRRASRLGWQAQLDLGNVSYYEQKDLDIQLLGARIGPALRLTDNGAAGIMAKGIYMDKDYEDYLRGWGGLAWTSWQLPGRVLLRAEGELVQRDFTQPADDGSDGTYGALRLAPTTLLGNNLLFGSIAYEFADTDDASESYDRLSAELRVRRPLLPRWQLHGEAFASVRKSLYDSPGPYSSSRRRDTEYVFGASIERVFRTNWLRLETWRVGLFYEYTKSCSNLDLYDYDRHLSGIRATVAF